ncbi:hypothetical protein JI435_410950 [Parastagonospora nodorum SN15]|uniref:Uncharacterized protein n=1 Tax=Phaeosphaeria nodorum (strain SN15 / ATCC MYA-4574 / FGSC 10173) TaxID=321614 RepID=A0A7U2F305_PHANO|nr:hypothetical protein JI435_410950 [Parastagonospora nodorum SN15]
MPSCASSHRRNVSGGEIRYMRSRYTFSDCNDRLRLQVLVCLVRNAC